MSILEAFRSFLEDQEQRSAEIAEGLPAQRAAYAQKYPQAAGFRDGFRKSQIESAERMVRGADTVKDFVPVVGDIVGAAEFVDEVSSDDPNYLTAGLLGAGMIAGTVPVAGDFVQKGLGSLADMAKRIEIDPNTLGMSGGNVKFKAKDDEPVSTYTTAKGSTYEQYSDATTTRNRAYRPSDDIKGEISGPQPRSGKTVYMSREAINEFGPMFQYTEQPSAFVPLPGNKAKLVLREDFGPRPAGTDLTGELDFSLVPEKGLHPVEIYRSDNSNSRNIHFGNEIVSVDKPVKKFSDGGVAQLGHYL